MTQMSVAFTAHDFGAPHEEAVVFRDGHTREVTLTVVERPRLPSDLAE